MPAVVDAISEDNGVVHALQHEKCVILEQFSLLSAVLCYHCFLVFLTVSFWNTKPDVRQS